MIDKDHKFGEVICDGMVMELWDRPNDHHDLGKWNGRPDTWWLRKVDTYDDVVEWIPWIDIGTKRPCWKLEFSEENFSSFKWDEWRVSGSVHCRMYLNGTPVYSFRSGDLSYAMARAQVLQVELTEMIPVLDHIVRGKPFKALKVWYKGQPGVVTELTSSGEVKIEPDGIEYFEMLEPHMTEDYEKEWAQEWKELRYVRDDALSPQIRWYRD
jgi:hypothetical protein